jgi:hypothetical protein
VDLSQFLNVLLVAALGAVGYLYRTSREEKDKLQERLHDSKREWYEQYVDILADIAKDSKAATARDNKAWVDKLRAFSFRLPLIASDEVVRAHIRFINLQRILDRPDAALPAVADVLLAIRRDIGFPDTRIRPGHILGVIVNELDAVQAPFDEWARARDDWDRRMGWD